MPIPSIAYIITALVVLAILAIFLLFIRKKTGQKKPSRLVFIALLLIISGIVFGEDRLIGYGLMGAGGLLAVIDIVIRYRNQGKTQ